MRSLILRLACDAMHDDESIPVLSDAVLQYEWYDSRMLDTYGVQYETNLAIAAMRPPYHETKRRWAAQVASVILFGSNATRPWPTVMRAWTYRNPNRRTSRHQIGFDPLVLSPHGVGTTMMAPEISFRGQALIIPETDAEGIMVESISIGRLNVLQGAVSALVFSERSIHNIDFPTCQPNQMITLRMHNQTDQTKTVRAMMRGVVVENEYEPITYDPIVEATRRL